MNIMTYLLIAVGIQGYILAACAFSAPVIHQYAVLFKGGPAGLNDTGTSLSCLRIAEFKGLAASLAGIEKDHIRFTEALKTDLFLAAGRIIPSEEDQGEEDEEEGDDSSSEESTSGSSLMYVEGISDANTLKKIVSRALLVHAAFEVWGVAPTMKECAEIVSALRDDDPRLEPLIREKQSWAAKVLVFGAKYGRRKSLKDLPKKLDIFEDLLQRLPGPLTVFQDLLLRLPGPVNLKSPRVQLSILEDGDTAEGEALHQVFFTREIGLGSKGLPQNLSLKRRSYVSTTSMDAKTSLVMANVAGLRIRERVLDPFAGSGGLLLAAAQLGAGVTVGIDVNSSIDLPKVESNFHQLGLPPPKTYVFGDAADEAVQERVYEWGPYDVILADPPYGKRERGVHRAEGAIQEAAFTLMKLGACNRILKVDGRMTFFVPAHPSCSDITVLLPSHPCLMITDASRQPLNAGLDRWLLTMTKVRNSMEGEEVQGPIELEREEADDDNKEGSRGKEGAEEEAIRIWHYENKVSTNKKKGVP